MKRLLKAISFLSLAALPAVSQAQCGQAFGDGEQLSYAVSYRAKLIPNIKVAEVKFATTAQTVDGTPTYHVWANGKVIPGFRWFFDLNDTYETWLDTATMKPVKFAGRLREGDYKFDMRYVYAWPRREVYTSYRNHKNKDPKYKTMSLSDESFDPIALFFNLRNTDMASFGKDESRRAHIVLEDTIRNIHYKFLGRERRKIGDMGKFETLKFSCELVSSSGESFEDGSIFYLWVSDDKNKIPLYVESPIRVGSIRATITGYANLKNPLDSKLK